MTKLKQVKQVITYNYDDLLGIRLEGLGPLCLCMIMIFLLDM